MATNDALPGVQLTQVNAPSTATLVDTQLFPVYVAPLYRIVANKQVLANAPFVDVTIGTPVLIDYPVIDPGAIVDLTSVLITIKNGVLQLLLKATGAAGFVAGNKTFTDNATDFIAAGVKAGDTVVVGDGSTQLGSYIVESVAQHILTFTYPVYMTFTGTDNGYYITRVISSWLLSTDNYVASLTEVTINSLTSGSNAFLSGEIDISYRALRTDKSGLVKYTNISDIFADMEVSSIQNKLGYYIENAVIPDNGGAIAFYVYYLNQDNDLAYLAALDDLTNASNIYMYVPLSDSEIVVNAYASNAQVLSDPENSQFRMLLTTTELIKQNILATGPVVLG
jgi:hypothetical protein